MPRAPRPEPGLSIPGPRAASRIPVRVRDCSGSLPNQEGNLNNEFAHATAHTFCSDAAHLTSQWIELVTATMHYRPRADLGVDTLRDHGPRLVREAAGFVGGDRGRPRGDVLEHLREVVEIRRSRGHDVQEVLREFDLLGEVLFDALRDLAVSRKPDPQQLSETGRRLHRGLAVIGTMTAGLYEEADRTERRMERQRSTRFRDDLAHEIKNPLGAALNALLTLREEGLGEDPELRARMLTLSERNVRRGLDLLDDLRTLADGADPNDEAPQEATPLATVIDAVVVEVSEEARRQSVELRVAGDLPAINVDRSRVQLALVNLVWNGIKYSDPTEDDRWVSVNAETTDDRLRIEVADNGVGIPPDQVERVFERFFRGSSEHGDGSGLGLPIPRDAIRQIGGGIEVESEEGAGSRFAATIPLAAREEEPAAAAPAREQQ